MDATDDDGSTTLMASNLQLTWRSFWIGTTGLFFFFFGLNYQLYAMPDALSVTVGGLVGAFVFAWVALRVTKLIMKARAPDAKYLCLIIAALSVGVQALRNFVMQ